MSKSWFYLILAFGAAVAIVRIWSAVRRHRAARAEDWDERLVRNLRTHGSDPFSPREVDFFFSLEEAAQCAPLAAELEADGFGVDYRAMDREVAAGFTLHARKLVRVTVPEMQAFGERFRALATRFGARYDGWATAGVTRPPAGTAPISGPSPPGA